MDRHFYSPSVNFTSYFIAKLCIWPDGDQQTELSQTLPNGGQQIVLTICRRKVGGHFSTKWGRGEKLLHLFGFRQLRDLVAIIFWTKHDRDNRARAWKVRGVFYVVSKFRALQSTKGLNYRTEFLHTLYRFCIILYCQPSHTKVNKRNSNFDKRKEVNSADVCRIRWRRMMNANETIEIMPLMFRAPKRISS